MEDCRSYNMSRNKGDAYNPFDALARTRQALGTLHLSWWAHEPVSAQEVQPNGMGTTNTGGRMYMIFSCWCPYTKGSSSSYSLSLIVGCLFHSSCHGGDYHLFGYIKIRVRCPCQATDKLFPQKSYNLPALAQMWLSNFSTSYLQALFYGNISVFKSVEAGNQNFVTKYNIHQTCWEARIAFSSIRWWAASKYSQECMTSWAVIILQWNQVGLRELTAYLGHPDHMSTLHSNVVYCIGSSFPPGSAIHTVTVPVADIKQERI